ncbi:FlxA-like family protein [Candidatus Uhrbacteria bacterium]|nr:FlxA-like family protein [Candidatus Uhrbacteria bacterium]
MFKGLAQNATKIVGFAALAAMIGYTLMLLFLPATMFGVSGQFQVPESAGINPYLAKVIKLTFGFLAAWLITKYMLGWNLLNKKILAFAGIVGVWIVYYFMMWGMTTAEPRKQARELQEQIKAQQAQIAQLREKDAQEQEEERGDKIQREDVSSRHTEENPASVMSALPSWVGTALWVILAIGAVFFLWFFGVPWVAYNLTLLVSYANWKGDPCMRRIEWPGFSYAGDVEHLDILKNLCYAILLCAVVVLLVLATCGPHQFFCAILILAILVIAVAVVLCFLNW